MYPDRYVLEKNGFFTKVGVDLSRLFSLFRFSGALSIGRDPGLFWLQSNQYRGIHDFYFRFWGVGHLFSV